MPNTEMVLTSLEQVCEVEPHALIKFLDSRWAGVWLTIPDVFKDNEDPKQTKWIATTLHESLRIFVAQRGQQTSS